MLFRSYGVPEPRPDIPVDHRNLDCTGTVWCVPGLAFDHRGRRLGRGAGWYDRLLQNAGPRRIGVTFADSLVEAVPQEPHDVSMNAIGTETGVWTVAEQTRDEPARPPAAGTHKLKRGKLQWTTP